MRTLRSGSRKRFTAYCDTQSYISSTDDKEHIYPSTTTLRVIRVLRDTRHPLGHPLGHHQDTIRTPPGHPTGHRRATAEHQSRETLVLISLWQRRGHSFLSPAHASSPRPLARTYETKRFSQSGDSVPLLMGPPRRETFRRQTFLNRSSRF